jgi:hypothetical protein
MGLVGKPFGSDDTPDRKLCIREAIETESGLKQSVDQAIVVIAAAAFEIEPLNDARRSGACSFRRPAPPLELEVSLRVRHRGHCCVVHDQAATVCDCSIRRRQAAADSALTNVRLPTFMMDGPWPAFSRL